MTSKNPALGHIPALDGFRGLAAVAVILLHARVPFAGIGMYAINAFFVLSSYLITSLLLAEMKRDGILRVGRFYLRRALRLYPALLCFLAVCLLPPFSGLPTIPPGIAKESVAAAALYLTDIAASYHWGAYPSTITLNTWSLSVEEKFYLLWPLLLLALRRMRTERLAVCLGAAYVVATAYRLAFIALDPVWSRVYYAFDTNLSNFMLGGFVAAWLACGEKTVAGTRGRVGAGLVAIAAAALLAGAWLHMKTGEEKVTSLVLCTPFEALSFFCILMCVSGPGGWARRFLGSRILVFSGRISYGLYLYHPLILYFALSYSWPVRAALTLAGAYAAATVSYYTVEAAARRYRQKPPARKENA